MNQRMKQLDIRGGRRCWECRYREQPCTQLPCPGCVGTSHKPNFTARHAAITPQEAIDDLEVSSAISPAEAHHMRAGAGQGQRSILQEAAELVGGQRNSDYGHPAKDFAKTAAIWNGILATKLAPGASIEPADVALCMIGVKLSREVNRHKRDNLVDIAGYAQTIMMLQEDGGRP